MGGHLLRRVGDRWDYGIVTEQDDAEAGATQPPTPGESWTNPFTAEFNRRKDELLAMPGFQLKTDLEGLARAGHTFWENGQDLARHAGLFLQGRRHVYNMTDEYEYELVRFLHNYLASVYSLIETQRVVMRHQWGTKSEFETETYAAKLSDVFDSGEADFMTKLRNYCTHRSLPVPAW